MEQGEVTRILQRLQAGERGASDQLIAAVYDELRRLAGACLRRERPGHTLQATGLVHEAWLRLVDQREWNMENHSHFFGAAAQTMRRILVDHARAAKAEKRGGEYAVVPLEDAMAVAIERPGDLLDVHRALERLGQLDEKRAQIAELRFFGGLNVDEIAEMLGIAPRTVDRHWRAARAWLCRELGQGDGSAEETV